MSDTRQTPPRAWTKANTSPKVIRLPTKGSAPYPASPGFIINDAQIRDPINTEWFSEMFPRFRITSEEPGDESIVEEKPRAPSSTSPRASLKKEKEKAKAEPETRPFPSTSGSGPSGWRTPERSDIPPPSREGSAKPSFDAGSPESTFRAAGPDSPLELNAIIKQLLLKVAITSNASEIAKTSGGLLLFKPTDPEEVLANIRPIIYFPPSKKAFAVVCAIAALLIRDTDPFTFRASEEDFPYLDNTLRTLLELIPARDRDPASLVIVLTSSGGITLSIAKAIVGEAATDTPEAIEAIAALLIAVIETWGNTRLAQFAHKAWDALRRKEMSSPSGAGSPFGNPRRTSVPLTPKARARPETPEPVTPSTRSPSASPSAAPTNKTKSKAKVPADEATVTFGDGRIFTYWRSTANARLRAPQIPDEDRLEVGVYIHTVLTDDGNDLQCWLNKPGERKWVDITASYKADDGKVLHPKYPAYCVTSKNGPKFILLTSLKSRKRKQAEGK